MIPVPQTQFTKHDLLVQVNTTSAVSVRVPPLYTAPEYPWTAIVDLRDKPNPDFHAAHHLHALTGLCTLTRRASCLQSAGGSRATGITT